MILTAQERFIVLSALHERVETLTRFVDQCSTLPLDQRNSPTDDPERWRKELADTESVIQRIQSSNPSDPND